MNQHSNCSHVVLWAREDEGEGDKDVWNMIIMR